jgi:hypothetical protein
VRNIKTKTTNLTSGCGRHSDLTNKTKGNSEVRVYSSVSSQSRTFQRPPTYITLRRDFWLTEQKGSYKLNPQKKGTVAEIGAHGMGLEQAGKLNNTETTSDY